MKIVKFVQPSCTPCRMLDAYLKHIGVSVDETYDIVVDESAFKLAQKLGVKSTPTIVLFDEDDNEVDRVSGLNQEGINALFARKEPSNK